MSVCHYHNKIIDQIEKRVAKDKYLNTSNSMVSTKDEIVKSVKWKQYNDVEDYDLPEDQDPYVMLVMRVNGSAKSDDDPEDCISTYHPG